MMSSPIIFLRSVQQMDGSMNVLVGGTALYERFASRGESDYQDKLLSAMRFGYGRQLEKFAT